mmetsp:Transcript_72587/g.228676  ORF Transcript_72587/g.228676 Transcript_72587/m.228676 type:complete len:213 (+) Transcript_72587:413-1051(+)
MAARNAPARRSSAGTVAFRTGGTATRLCCSAVPRLASACSHVSSPCRMSTCEKGCGSPGAESATTFPAARWLRRHLVGRWDMARSGMTRTAPSQGRVATWVPFGSLTQRREGGAVPTPSCRRPAPAPCAYTRPTSYISLPAPSSCFSFFIGMSVTQKDTRLMCLCTTEARASAPWLGGMRCLMHWRGTPSTPRLASSEPALASAPSSTSRKK